jgi:uncharacterized protein YjbI with pentapeptide repeats
MTRREIARPNIDLKGACLDRQRLLRARLRNAQLRFSSLRNADLRGADLRGADLRNSDLRGARLQGARYNRTTRWPAGFDPERSGARCIELRVEAETQS